MKSRIIEAAKNEKISDIGFCRVEDYKKGLSEEASFCASEEISGAKSIIVCAFSYYAGDAEGNISLYARGRDYHSVAREKMAKIAELLNEKGYFARVSADTGLLSERRLAQLSGIAFIGRNRMAISDTLGSYFFIGYVVTDCDLLPSEQNSGACMGCGACISACPQGVLGKEFCEEECLSYITQKRGALSEEEAEAMRRVNTAWGCDVCQRVCPHNRGICLTDIPEFLEDLIFNLEISEDISNREFKKLYGNRAFSWRGKNVLIRNRKIIYNIEESLTKNKN